MTPWIARTDADAEVIDEVGSALSNNTLQEWLTAGAILVVAFIIAKIVAKTVGRLMQRTTTSSFLGDLLGRLIAYVIIAFGAVYALEEVGVAIAPLLGALGVIGIAIAFALQSVLENFVAGVLLQIRQPFDRGDEIESMDYEGEVISIDARTMTIRTPDGKTVRLPNAEVIKQPIVNLTLLGLRRTTVDVGVAYGTDIARAARVAEHAVRVVDGVLSEPAVQVWAHSFGASSIDLAVRYWHAPTIAETWRVRHLVTVAIATAFDDNDITIPFPQRTLHIGDATIASVIEGRSTESQTRDASD